jgi:hypothetical protein
MDDVWPVNMSLDNFMNQRASQNLTQIINNYFKGKTDALSNLDEEIHQFGEALEAAINDLCSYLAKFTDEFALTSTYIR